MNGVQCLLRRNEISEHYIKHIFRNGGILTEENKYYSSAFERELYL